MWPAILSLIGVGANLYSGYKQKQSYEEGGEASRDASYANAADLVALAGDNRALATDAGVVNADAIRTIGEANAIAVEKATGRNMMIYGLQVDEDRRRFLIQQKETAGTIRAMAGASGVQTNTGSPLYYLNSQIDKSIREKRYGDIKAYWTLRNMYEEGTDKADIIRLTADQQANVTEYNANVQSEMAYNDAIRQAAAMQRSGDVNAQIGAAQGSAAMWGGIGNAIGGFAGMVGTFGAPSTWFGGSTGAYNTTTSAWSQSSNWNTPSPYSGFAPSSNYVAFQSPYG